MTEIDSLTLEFEEQLRRDIVQDTNRPRELTEYDIQSIRQKAKTLAIRRFLHTDKEKGLDYLEQIYTQEPFNWPLYINETDSTYLYYVDQLISSGKNHYFSIYVNNNRMPFSRFWNLAYILSIKYNNTTLQEILKTKSVFPVKGELFYILYWLFIIEDCYLFEVIFNHLYLMDESLYLGIWDKMFSYSTENLAFEHDIKDNIWKLSQNPSFQTFLESCPKHVRDRSLLWCINNGLSDYKHNKVVFVIAQMILENKITNDILKYVLKWYL